MRRSKGCSVEIDDATSITKEGAHLLALLIWGFHSLSVLRSECSVCLVNRWTNDYLIPKEIFTFSQCSKLLNSLHALALAAVEIIDWF